MLKIFSKKDNKTEIEKAISKREKEVDNFNKAFDAIQELNKSMMQNIEIMKKEYSKMMKGN